MVTNGHSKREVDSVTANDAFAWVYAGYPSQGAF